MPSVSIFILTQSGTSGPVHETRQHLTLVTVCATKDIALRHTLYFSSHKIFIYRPKVVLKLCFFTSISVLPN